MSETKTRISVSREVSSAIKVLYLSDKGRQILKLQYRLEENPEEIQSADLCELSIYSKLLRQRDLPL